MNKIMYLDAAASALKPDCVIAAESDFLRNGYANSGRGVCARAVAVDTMVDLARERVAQFINAASDQVVFTAGATDGLNRVVQIVMQKFAGRVPVVCVSDLDHHSARLPWEMLARVRGCKIVDVALDADFNFDIAGVPYCDVVVLTAMSNVLGVAQNVSEIIRIARKKNPNVIVIVDAAQYVVHESIDAKKWDADFILFSGHKIGADTGIGVMFIKNPDAYSPDRFGGGMVQTVDAGDIVFNRGPIKFEAGTLPLTQIAGLAPAIDYLASHRPNLDLIKYLYDALAQNRRIKILTSRDATLLTFVIHDMHVLDFGALVGAHNVCVRVGNMCASWIHNRMWHAGTVRISVGPWNTMDEMHRVTEIINSIVK